MINFLFVYIFLSEPRLDKINVLLLDNTYAIIMYFDRWEQMRV